MSEVGINPLFFVGVVEDRNDPRLEGRVKVRAFGFHGTNAQIQTEDLPWATLILGHHSPNFTPPPLNAWVFGFFVDGRDAQQPMILGIIPTQMLEVVDPAANGHGAIAPTNHELHSMGHRPKDFGQPMLPASARGEMSDTTYAIAQEMNRINSAKIAGTDDTWSEPGTAYSPQYPFNHVYETASGHSLEMDDTPGAERIMLYHRAGSFVQIDNNGNMVIKTPNDSTIVTEGNHHMFVGGAGSGARSVVTIMGDSHVYVDGNKIEEVRGDLKTIVHGNYLLDVAGQMNLNVSDEGQLRAAKLTLESNVENFSVKSGKQIRLSSAEELHLKTENMFIQSSSGINIKADTMFTEIGSGYNLKAATIGMQSNGQFRARGADIRIGGGSAVSISAATVYMDDIIRMAEGSSQEPTAVEGQATEAIEAIPADLPEPTSKSVQTNEAPNQRANYGSGGYATTDDGTEVITDASLGSSGGQSSFNPVSNPVAVRELYDYMRETGLTHEQAVGALVNVKRESSFNAGAVGDNGNSFGLFQFNLPAGRARPFLNEVPDWQTNPRGQINFMFTRDPQGVAYKNRSFSSSIEAANWFTNRVEIPQDRASYTAPGGFNDQNIGEIETIVGGSRNQTRPI